MENNGNKIRLTSTRKALKFRNQMTTFWTIIFVLGLAVSLYGVHYSYYRDYKVQMSKYQTAVTMMEKCRRATTVEEQQKIVKEAENAGIDLHSYYYGYPHKPELLSETYFVISVLAGIVFIICLLCLYYGYWGALCDTKDFIEFDPETGECRLVEHFRMNQDHEYHRVIDVITGIDMERSIHCKELNVGTLTIYGKYIVADEVYSLSRKLKYCDNLKESAEKVQEFMRQRGMDAVKVKVIED